MPDAYQEPITRKSIQLGIPAWNSGVLSYSNQSIPLFGSLL